MCSSELSVLELGDEYKVIYKCILTEQRRRCYLHYLLKLSYAIRNEITSFYCCFYYLFKVAYTPSDTSVHWQKFNAIKQTTYVIPRNKLSVNSDLRAEVTKLNHLQRELSPVVSSCSKHDVSLRFLQSSSGNKSQAARAAAPITRLVYRNVAVAVAGQKARVARQPVDK